MFRESLRGLYPILLLAALSVPGLGCGSRRLNLSGTAPSYPGATKPDEILANVGRIAVAGWLAESYNMPELLGPLKARRILRVKSLLPTAVPEWFVVELQAPSGRDLGIFDIAVDGTHWIDFVDCRQPPNSTMLRPLDLSDAEGRVLQHRGRAPLNAEYVYLNRFEEGVSYDRPVVAVTTESGIIYVNSRGESFAEGESPLVAEAGGAERTLLVRTPPGYYQRFRCLGLW